MTYTFEDFRNQSGLKFTDISSEEWREYIRDGFVTVRIDEPVALSVSKSGGHRLFDASGVCHYVTPGWQLLKWKAKEGQPHFVA